jgi:hypothetical protein
VSQASPNGRASVGRETTARNPRSGTGKYFTLGSEQARGMFAKTPSFDAIVDRGHTLLLAAIGRHLAGRPPVRR